MPSGLRPRTFYQNAFWLLTAQGLAILIQLAWAKVIASHLGPGDLGVYTYALALTQVLGLLSDFGLNTYLVRESARDRTKDGWLLSNAMSLKLAATVVSWAALAAVLALSRPSPAAVRTVLFFALANLSQTLSAVFICLYRGRETMGYEAASVVLSNLLNLSLCLAAMKLRLHLPWFGAAYAAASAAQLFFLWANYHRSQEWPGLRLDPSFLRSWLRTVTWLGLGGLFFFIYDRGPQLILSHIDSDASVGLYAAVYRLMAAALVPPVIIGNVLLPRLSSLMSSGRRSETYGVTLKLLSMLSAAGLSVSLALFFGAGGIIAFFYGPEFVQAVPVLKAASWLAAAVFPGAMLMNLLIAQGGEKQYALFSGVEMAVCLAGCLLAVPRWGALGAAVSMVAAAFLVNGMLAAAMARRWHTLRSDG